MPESETVRKQLVSIDVDTAAARRVKAHVTELKRDLAGLKVAGGDMAQGFVQAGRQTTMMAQLTREVTRLKTETRSAAVETEKLADAETAADRARRDMTTRRRAQTLGRVETSVRGITGPVSMLGGAELVRPLNVGADLFGAAQGAKLLKQDLGDLTNQMVNATGGVGNLALAGGAAAVAAVGLYLAIDALGDSAEKSRQKVLAEIEFERRRTEVAPERQDTEAIKEQVKALDDAIAARSEEIDRLEEDKAKLFDSYSALEQLGEATGLYNQGLDDYKSRLKALNTEQEADIKLRDELTQTLTASTTVTNDAMVAAEAATKARVDQFEQETRFILQARQLSAQQIRDREKQIREEMLWYGALQRDLEVLAPTSDYASQQLKAVTQTLDNLALEASVLKSATPRAEKRETEREASELFQNIIGLATQGAEVVTNAVTGVGQAATQASQKLDSYADHMAEVEEDRLRQSIREEADAARSRTRAIADFYRQQAKLDEQYFERRGDILDEIGDASTDADKERIKTLREANQEAIKAARDHQQRILEIHQQTNFDIQKAEMRLDAVALWEAQRQGEREMRAEEDRYAEEKRQREADTRDRVREIREQRNERIRAGKQALRDLEQQHTKERAENDRTFRLQLAREDEDRRIRQQRQQQDWAIQDQRYRAHNQIIETATSSHYTNVQGRTVTGMANVAGAYSGGLGNLITITQQKLASAAAAVQSASRIYVPTNEAHYGYAGGGDPPVGRDVIVGERGWEMVRFMQPARVYSHDQSMAMLGGRGKLDINLTVRGDGSLGGRSDAQLQRLFEPMLRQALGELKQGTM